jgi:hypothetical protein
MMLTFPRRGSLACMCSFVPFPFQSTLPNVFMAAAPIDAPRSHRRHNARVATCMTTNSKQTKLTGAITTSATILSLFQRVI